MANQNSVPKQHPQVPQAAKNPQNFVALPGPVFGAISQYLDKKPHGEVSQLVQLMNSSAFTLKEFVEFQRDLSLAQEKPAPIEKVTPKKPTKKKKTKK